MSYDLELESEPEFSPSAREFLRKQALAKKQQHDADAANHSTQEWLDYIDNRISAHLDVFEKQLLEVAAKKYEFEALQKELAELKCAKTKVVLIDAAQALNRRNEKVLANIQWLIDRRVRKALDEEQQRGHVVDLPRRGAR